MQRPWVSSKAYEAAIAFLIKQREGQQLTQREFAERLGKPRSFVSKIEGRERRIDVVEFVAIARALGLSAGLLMDELSKELPEKLDF